MEAYKQHSITLIFTNDNGVNEPMVLQSLMNKVEALARKPGFKKDFDPDEIELIKTTKAVIDKLVG